MTYGVVISYCGKGYSKSRKKNGRPGFFQKTNEAHYLKSTENAQDSEFRSFFGRIEETIICFRDLLTFRYIFGIKIHTRVNVAFKR